MPFCGVGFEVVEKDENIEKVFGFDHLTMWKRSQIKGLLNYFVLSVFGANTKDRRNPSKSKTLWVAFVSFF